MTVISRHSKQVTIFFLFTPSQIRVKGVEPKITTESPWESETSSYSSLKTPTTTKSQPLLQERITRRNTYGTVPFCWKLSTSCNNTCALCEPATARALITPSTGWRRIESGQLRWMGEKKGAVVRQTDSGTKTERGQERLCRISRQSLRAGVSK